ncbi:hypothetical protein MAPG_02405 [Magnaporthiopsis poae ATCC 64411]|uniref:Uncharacterized protein n=1 Tax=Magnaporthiopsis poae (strain ATCC 64411 / 73-15) TaxID=644358 RepID=A0A0C4DR99_MAGP6|nr:hypothetical protein MAPG_02405 [Magnaporthiopsis poae ATCC 64411]
MFCDAGSRILRKCRSERRLRAKSTPQHVRKDSTFSTASSESLDRSSHHRQPRPSTDRDDSHRPRMSEDDWDPLRLHPPMDDARSPHITSRGQPSDSQQPTPQPPVVDRGTSCNRYGNDADMDDIISSYGLTALRPPPPLANRRPLLPRMKTAEMDIHDGFDFGFIDGSPISPTSPTERLPHQHHHHNHHQLHQHRYQNNLHSATSPVSIVARHRRPSTASSTTSECSSILIPSHGAAGLPTAPLPMAPSSNQTRPRPSLGSPDSPSFMLKRGDWKRRGIIFISEEAKVTEDDCFEIP